MKPEEGKEIQKITKDFSKAINIFNSRDYKNAMDSFEKIDRDHENSEFYSVIDIRRKALSYIRICDTKLSLSKIKQKSNEDYINEIVFSLNQGDLDQAEKYFSSLSKKKFNSPFLDYLRSIFYLKSNEEEKSLDYLKKCIDKDDSFKITANNEPDFEPVFENERFISIID